MKLLYQTHSPYARKVLVFAHETGQAAGLDVIHHETSPVRRNETVYRMNPLGKVPVLILPDDSSLFDSLVICDYLDSLHAGPRLIPEQGSARWAALRLEALAQGICDAGIRLRSETERRPEAFRYALYAEGQAGKLMTTYDFIEKRVPLDGPMTIGHIALATALDWILFRKLPDFSGCPRLTDWYREFRKRPSMLATVYSGQTQD
ncbi:glutathione S-transferase family protein [Zobellella iuensis]|uniref:Glutathione S-transferase n=1 Tax=Zobellella iuensis TaxID=2803811 RepID=A0ABS1QRH5_9GAMM|nr:glutathione S-transferase [Zobellella iuensis]MBL1377470.1 glutathione S-transferase [Zobellella iuensis]